MFYRIDATNGAAHYSTGFTQNATSQGALAASTRFPGPPAWCSVFPITSALIWELFR